MFVVCLAPVVMAGVFFLAFLKLMFAFKAKKRILSPVAFLMIIKG